MAIEWYCAQTYPLREMAARRRLRDQEFDVYLPLETVRRPISGRVVDQQKPLFPGYLFVQLDLDDDPEQRWKGVSYTKAIMSLLPSSERPEIIQRSQIERLADFEKQGFFKRGTVRPGERVRVWRGMLADQVLECIESHDDRIRCLWNCFGAPRVVNLRISEVTVLH